MKIVTGLSPDVTAPLTAATAAAVSDVSDGGAGDGS